MCAAVRCIIVGCPSESVKDLKLQFNRFPMPDSPHYNVLLDIFHSSAYEIRKHSRRFICSKHFIITEDINGRRLAVPSLNSNNLPDSTEKERLAKLLNETVREWCSRAHNISQSTCILAHVAMTVRQLLGPFLCQLTIDESWCQKFRLNYLNPFPTRKVGKSVNLKDIIKELDPNVQIYTKQFNTASLNWDNFIPLDVIKELSPHAKMYTKQFDEAELINDVKVTEVTNKTFDSKSTHKSFVSEIKADKSKKPPLIDFGQFISPSHSIFKTNISSNHTNVKCEPIIMKSEQINIGDNDNIGHIVDISREIIIMDKHDHTSIESANKVTTSMVHDSTIKIKPKDDIIFQPNVNTYTICDSSIEDLFLQSVKSVVGRPIHGHNVCRTESNDSDNRDYSHFELKIKGSSIEIEVSDKKVHPIGVIYEFSDCDIKNEFLKQSVGNIAGNTRVSKSPDRVNSDISDKPNRDVDSVIQNNCQSDLSINIEAKDDNKDFRSVTKVVGNAAARHKSPDKVYRDDSRDRQNRDYSYVDVMTPEYSNSNMSNASAAKDDYKDSCSVGHKTVNKVISVESSESQNTDCYNTDSVIEESSSSNLSSEIEAEDDNELPSNVNVYEFSESDMESEIFKQSFRENAGKARVRPTCKTRGSAYATRVSDEKIGTKKNYQAYYLNYVNDYSVAKIFFSEKFNFSKVKKRLRQDQPKERHLKPSKSQAQQMKTSPHSAFLTGLECDNDPLHEPKRYVIDKLVSKPKVEVKSANYYEYNDTGRRSILTNVRQINNSDSIIVNGIDEEDTIGI